VGKSIRYQIAIVSGGVGVGGEGGVRGVEPADLNTVSAMLLP